LLFHIQNTKRIVVLCLFIFLKAFRNIFSLNTINQNCRNLTPLNTYVDWSYFLFWIFAIFFLSVNFVFLSEWYSILFLWKNVWKEIFQFEPCLQQSFISFGIDYY
jgi:hypothetical protein